MKQLQCKSCGGPIKIKDDKYVTCEYCGAQYELDTDIREKIYKDVRSVIKTKMELSKKIVKVFLIFMVVTFTISMITALIYGKNSLDGKTNELEASEQKKKKEEEIEKFNRKFEYYGGTQSKYMVEELLDDVSTSNRKNERKIEIIYKDILTSTTEEIIEIKHSLTQNKYEVIIYYDADKCINQIKIEKI